MRRQGAGDADALALTAGKFVRVAVECLRAQANLERQLLDPLGERAAAGHTVIDQRLADNVADLEARVERRIRVLKDDLQLAAVRAYLAARQPNRWPG
jgi:hypothetical protein